MTIPGAHKPARRLAVLIPVLIAVPLVLVLVAAAAVLVVVGAAQAGSGLIRAASPAPTASGPPVITEPDARALLADVVGKNNQANATLDSKLLAEYEAESSFRLDDAVYRIGRVLDPQRKDPIKPFEYIVPRFHVPRSTKFPQFFFVTATVERSRNSYVLVFARDTAGAPWKIVMQAALNGTSSIPTLARDEAGTYPLLAPADGGRAQLAPANAAKAHAAYLTGGMGVPEASVFGPDRHSAEIVDDGALRQQLQFVNTKTGKAAPAQKFTRTVTVEPYPVRALQTLDGGSVVAYVTRWQVTAEQTDGLTKLTGADAALAGRTDFAGKITITWLTQWVVLVPPADSPMKLTVLAAYTGKESIT